MSTANNVTPAQSATAANVIVAGAQVGASGGSPSSSDGARALFPSSATRTTTANVGDDGLVAAINSGEENVNDEAVILAELKVQNDIFSEGDKEKRKSLINTFYHKVVGTTSVVCFVGVSDGLLRVVHGIGKYVAGLVEESTYDQTLIGFVGDRSKSKDPVAVKVDGSSLTWTNYSASFHSEASFRQFYMKSENRTKFYIMQENDSSSATLLPNMLYVPRGHVEWLLKKPRRPFEYHEYIISQLGGDSPDKRPNEISVALAFLQRACLASGSSRDKSVMEMTLAPIYRDDTPQLSKWLDGRLLTILGPSAAAMAPVVNNVWTLPDGLPPKEGGTTTSNSEERGGGTTSASSDKAALSPLQISALKGYCNTMFEHGIPEVWTKMGTTNEVEELRRYIDDAWEESRKALGIDEGECNKFFLDDQTIKEWKKGNFAPGGAVLVWEHLMKGMSLLLMMPTSARTQLKIKEQQGVYQDTINTRTEEQAARMNKKAVRQPPRDWSELKYLVNTYAVMLRALYGALCPHFKSVWVMRGVIVKLKEQKSHFNDYACRLLTAHILKDSRFFFSVQLMPKHFEGATQKHEVLWPESFLADAARQVFGLRFNTLEIADMPYNWRDNKSDGIKRQATEQGGRSVGGPQQWNQQQGGQRSGQGTGGQSSHVKHDEIPHKIRHHLGHLIHECVELTRGNFRFGDLLEVGGLQLRYVPRLRSYCESDGRSAMCNGSLIGRCRFDDSSCRFRRVMPQDLSDDFVAEYVRVVRPALEKCISVFRSQRANGNSGPGPDRARSSGSRLF